MRFVCFIHKDSFYFLLCNFIYFIIFTTFNFSKSEEWCKVSSKDSVNRYEQCLPDGENYATYTIDVTTLSVDNNVINGDINIIIVGDGKETKPITIASKSGTYKRLSVDRLDVGDLKHIDVVLGDSIWSCEKITVFKKSKYWSFDCFNSNPSEKHAKYATYLLSGNKSYTICVQTGNLNDSGTTGSISIALIGLFDKTNSKVLGNSFNYGSYLTFHIKAADIGDIIGLVLTNDSKSDPWYCESVRIVYPDNSIKSFMVKRWIGYPYDTSALISTETGSSVVNFSESVPIDIQCNTRAIDLFTGIVSRPFNIIVRCPMNCQTDDLVRIEGTSIHPSTTSICGASLIDNVITKSGGDVVVCIMQPIKKYFGSHNSEYNINSYDYEPPADLEYFSFSLYLNESIDNIDSNVRLVDPFGKLSSVGRLEVLRNGKWGTVCNKGKSTYFNNKAAEVVCKTLGFDYAVIITDNCSSVNNQNFCAPLGYHVSYSGITCNGDEDDISKCTFEDPTIDCKRHKDDVIIKCSNKKGADELQYGVLRIVDSTGSISSNGTGRLEMYNDGFGSICNESWDKNAETIACIEMGYDGIKNGGLSDHECSDLNGINLCAPYLNKISAANFQCDGTEKHLSQCKHEYNDDIYCTHDQDVIISCEGNGDPSEFRSFKYVENFVPQIKKFDKILNLTCYDNILSRSEFHHPIGKYLLAICPQDCANEQSAIKGTFIYTNDSPICKSAIHSGIIDNNGGEVIVVIATPQPEYYGSFMNGISSIHVSNNSYDLKSPAFIVSKPTKYVRSKYNRSVIEKDKEHPRVIGEHSPQDFPIMPSCKYEWTPPREWKGFNGKSFDYVNTRDYPGSKSIKSFKNFTFIIEIIPTGGIGQWNDIFSFQNCGGLICAIDNMGEIILQENCKANLLKTGYFPVIGRRIVLVVTYYSVTHDISIFVNGELANTLESDLNLNFQGDLIIGKSADIDADYFIGQIMVFKAFDQVLSPEQIRQEFDKTELIGYNKTSNIRLTTEGNVCLSKCVENKPEYDPYIMTTNPSISLMCDDTIDKEVFNGPTGKMFLVSCPNSCMDTPVPIRGSKVYTSDSPICKAAIHSGATQKEGGEAIITILRGLTSYKSCHGHYGITSQKSNIPYLRSFTVHEAPQQIHLSCIDNAIFVLNMNPGSRLLLHCPSGCKNIDADVYGTYIYNPVSSLCRAAIHSGKLDDDGGEVEIEVVGEQHHFHSTESNGIISQISGQYLRSFKIVRATKNYF